MQKRGKPTLEINRVSYLNIDALLCIATALFKCHLRNIGGARTLWPHLHMPIIVPRIIPLTINCVGPKWSHLTICLTSHRRSGMVKGGIPYFGPSDVTWCILTYQLGHPQAKTRIWVQSYNIAWLTNLMELLSSWFILSSFSCSCRELTSCAGTM